MPRTMRILPIFLNAGPIRTMLKRRMTVRTRMSLKITTMILLRIPRKTLRPIRCPRPKSSKRSLAGNQSFFARKPLLLMIQEMTKTTSPQGNLTLTREVLLGTLLDRVTLL